MSGDHRVETSELPTRIARLASTDIDLARSVFALMAAVFDETPSEPLGDSYLRALLSRPGFFALAALRDGKPVGGITAHAVPMTRDESAELFIYDLAVHSQFQRQGIGRRLVTELGRVAAAEGIRVAFVPADADDGHALDFYRALGGSEAPVRIFTFTTS